jgi:hypothetical protein
MYYLGEYFGLKKNKILAEKFFLMAREFHRTDTIEWRLNEWALEDAGLILTRAEKLQAEIQTNEKTFAPN